MADYCQREDDESHLQQEQMQQEQMPQQQQLQNTFIYQITKVVLAAMIGGLMLFFSGVTLLHTAITIMVAMPTIVMFSTFIGPAIVTVWLIFVGFLTWGVLGVAAISVLSWIYMYVTGNRPVGADVIDMLAARARQFKEWVLRRIKRATP